MRLQAAAFAVAATLLAVPVAAEEPAPEAAPLETFFHCSGDSKVLNALTVQAPPSWNETAPSASVQSGAGCGFADPGARTGTNQENVYDAVFKGFHAGNLDSLTVRLYDMGVGAARTGAAQELGIRLSVDGRSMFDTITPEASPTDIVFGDPVPVPATTSVTVTPTPTNTGGATNFVQFTINGLGYMEEGGAGSIEREIVLTVNSKSEQASAWVLDTTEVPSGITFNPATPAAATLAATTPGPTAVPATEPTPAPTPSP